MKKHVQEGGKDRPIVILDPDQGSVFIGGSSLPENVLEIYGPIIDWLDLYIENPKSKTKIDFFFEYLNTASSHMIMRCFDKIKLLFRKCPEINVNWHYLKGDFDMRDFGNELAELVDFQINIIDSEQFELKHYQ